MILAILGNSFFFSPSWNLNLYWNLIDLKIEHLERLIPSLIHVHLSPSILGAKAWSLTMLDLFLVKFFFMALPHILDPIPFS